MAGEGPVTKRQRTSENDKEAEMNDDEVAKLQSALDEIEKIDIELDKENNEMAKEVLAIESKYNIRKRPVYQKRSAILNGIPNFWKQTLCNHGMLSQCMTEEDANIMDYLKTLDVTFIDESGGFKIELEFVENPFLKQCMLWKEIKFEDEDGEMDINTGELKWKETPEAQEISKKSRFFDEFLAKDEDQMIAEVIKDDIWKNPVQHFLNKDDDDEEMWIEGDDDENEDENDDEDDDDDDDDDDE